MTTEQLSFTNWVVVCCTVHQNHGNILVGTDNSIFVFVLLSITTKYCKMFYVFYICKHINPRLTWYLVKTEINILFEHLSDIYLHLKLYVSKETLRESSCIVCTEMWKAAVSNSSLFIELYAYLLMFL